MPLVSLLIASLLHSPANAEAAQLYRENMKEYVRRVKATVEASWLDEGEGAGLEAVAEEGAAPGAGAAQGENAAAAGQATA